jgi:redox-sensitive bicupin YhaK (pirin superfamily)
MSREVTAVVQTVREKEGAGFYVRRPMPTEKVNSVDPFLLLDHFGPDTHVRKLRVLLFYRLQAKRKVRQIIHIVE